ncbi:cell wall hydrolase [Novosphingobium sp. SG720]|uniref:cell wall hydrolase n=1 Tax=Novosphingobium sp. SG720 TaxID=2586998 RepID=UPI0017E2F8F8|nr:cell wall hydrolase [Novosphingobium sp. SG720]NKJ41201.1 spore germination cell wall hydrolase CwlJ-like protein [Novosphingobium sp. SG720]
MPDPSPFTGATPTLPPEALMPPPGPEERAMLAQRRQADGALLQALTLAPVRPRDFAARIRRRDMTSWRHQHRAGSRLAERAAGIAAIGALGLVLGAVGWGSPGIDAAAAHDRNGLQPFERAGESFPGSAFYYVSAQDSGLLAPQDAARAWDRQVAAIHGDADDAPTLAAWARNPAARPLFASGSGEDRWRALQCLTTAIYYEAASEPDAGQRAVAQVVLNRVAHPAFPKTVCGVVYQGSERPGCQFSFACDGAMARRPVQQFWDRARRVAADALAGNVFAPVGLATHYHTSAVHPLWADKLAFIGTIGAHRFYRWAGTAGLPAAFTGTYRGAEPLAAPHPRSWVPVAADLADPLTLEKAFEEGRMAALERTTAGPGGTPLAQPAGTGLRAVDSPLRGTAPAGPALSGTPLPGAPSGQLRPEASEAYENAGKWIAQPHG